MIRVAQAEEPLSFNELVRQPGLRAITELVGEPSTPRPGPKRKAIYAKREDIPASAFPEYWTEALDEMLTRYNRLCAYIACYIEPGSTPSVDHMIPKSRAWDKVYEWSNYRLASLSVNNLKKVHTDFLDPFDVQDDWFELNLINYKVLTRDQLPQQLVQAATNTLKCLNHQTFCDLRRDYAENYTNQHISLNYLERRSPFVARELRRQNRLLPQDKTPRTTNAE